MAPPINKKCQNCSRLTRANAIAKHGPDGDGCWAGASCDNRRSHYRHRLQRNQGRKQKETHKPENAREPATLSVATMAVPTAYLFVYAKDKFSPIHAITAELWSGHELIAKIDPMHCHGLTEAPMNTLAVQILAKFSEYAGKTISAFRALEYREPSSCTIRPCPLHPDG